MEHRPEFPLGPVYDSMFRLWVVGEHWRWHGCQTHSTQIDIITIRIKELITRPTHPLTPTWQDHIPETHTYLIIDACWWPTCSVDKEPWHYAYAKDQLSSRVVQFDTAYDADGKLVLPQRSHLPFV
eukprot:4254985-Amphidinium_carterae.1